jgi:hypothetical protein
VLQQVDATIALDLLLQGGSNLQDENDLRYVRATSWWRWAYLEHVFDTRLIELLRRDDVLAYM